MILFFKHLRLIVALEFGIPIALHIVFRSGGMVGSLIIGYLYAGKRYSVSQLMAVFTVTVGVVVATLANANKRQSETKLWGFVCGLVVLVVALVGSSFLGLWQVCQGLFNCCAS